MLLEIALECPDGVPPLGGTIFLTFPPIIHVNLLVLRLVEPLYRRN